MSDPDVGELIAGVTCLDFANTVGPRRPPPDVTVTDRIPDYAALLSWSVHAGLLDVAAARRLATEAAEGERRASAVHADALELREAVYATFAALANDLRAPRGALLTVEAAYVTALGHAHLVDAGDRHEWQVPDRGPLDLVVWPIADSAVELARSPVRSRIKQCPGDDGACGWLFLDTTKNGTRRWCSMSSCGNRLKSRRQAARRRRDP